MTSSSSSSQSVITKKIDDLIYDCYQKSTDILLPGRNAYMIPLRESSERVADTGDYYKHVIKRWNTHITQPLMIDLYFLDPASQQHILFEKWVFYYQRRDGPQESRVVHVANLRLITFLRALYSTVRLLPGFQLLFATRSMSAVSYRIYNPETAEQPLFHVDPVGYDFPKINTSKGILNVSVRYIEAITLQHILNTPLYFVLRSAAVKRSSMAPVIKQHSNSNMSQNQGSNLSSSSRKSSHGQMPSPGDNQGSMASPDNTAIPRSSPTSQGRNLSSMGGMPPRQSLTSDNMVSASPGSFKYGKALPIGNGEFSSSGRRLGHSPESAATSCSPMQPLPAFMIDPAGQAAYNRIIECGSYGEQYPTIDRRALAIPQLTNIEEFESTNITPPYSNFSAALISTSPQLGSASMTNLVQSIRTTVSQANSLKKQSSMEINLVDLPASPFDSISGNADLAIDEKSINKFVKEVVYRNRNRLSIYNISNQDEDDDDSDEDIDSFKQKLSTMAFATHASIHEVVSSPEEKYSQIIPLKTKSFRALSHHSDNLAPLDVMKLEIKSHEDFKDNLLSRTK